MEATFSPTEFLGYLAQELIDNFTRAGKATTPGLVGGAREVEVRRKLEMLLPEKVAVATGCVIDSHGTTSNQADVVIHERDNCPVFSINGAAEATYIPCEGTVAVGEIKSTLNTKELRDSVSKLQKIKGLHRAFQDKTCFRHYGSAMLIQGAESESYDPINKIWDQTYCFVLCQSFGISQETLAKHYTIFCAEAEPHLAPSMVLSLTDGIMMLADENGQLLRNGVGAKRVAFFRHPGGDFQYLLSEIVEACNNGRTTDVFPHSRYLLGQHRGATVQPTYFAMAGNYAD
jgi:hypothetical protein